jgi:hypothetical protein
MRNRCHQAAEDGAYCHNVTVSACRRCGAEATEEDDRCALAIEEIYHTEFAALVKGFLET